MYLKCVELCLKFLSFFAFLYTCVNAWSDYRIATLYLWERGCNEESVSFPTTAHKDCDHSRLEIEDRTAPNRYDSHLLNSNLSIVKVGISGVR